MNVNEFKQCLLFCVLALIFGLTVASNVPVQAPKADELLTVVCDESTAIQYVAPAKNASYEAEICGFYR